MSVTNVEKYFIKVLQTGMPTVISGSLVALLVQCKTLEGLQYMVNVR